jgi:hypothetical protein
VLRSKRMAPAEVLRGLESLARRLGVATRFETLDAQTHARGGLCKLHGQPLIIVDLAASTVEQIAVISEALRAFDIEAIYIPPFLRAQLERSRAAVRTGAQSGRELGTREQ